MQAAHDAVRRLLNFQQLRLHTHLRFAKCNRRFSRENHHLPGAIPHSLCIFNIHFGKIRHFYCNLQYQTLRRITVPSVCRLCVPVSHQQRSIKLRHVYQFIQDLSQKLPGSALCWGCLCSDHSCAATGSWLSPWKETLPKVAKIHHF